VEANVNEAIGLAGEGPSQLQVISAIYDTVLQPQCYDRFSDRRLNGGNSEAPFDIWGQNPAAVAPHFAFHFAKALETLRDQWANKSSPDPAYVYEDGGGAWLVTTLGARALRCSREARRIIDVLPRDVLKTLEANSLVNLRVWEEFAGRLQSGTFTWDDFIVLSSQKPGTLLLCRPVSAGSVVSETALVMVEVLDVPMFSGAISYLKQGFNLDEEEADALACLMSGKAVFDKNWPSRAVWQAVAKAGAPGPAELIRLAASLVKEHASDVAIASGAAMPPSGTLVIPGGTRTQYLRLGAETGKSVVFMHGLLDCLAGVLRLQTEFRRLGFRVYVPLRNGYGDSGPVPKGDRHLDVFSEQFGALMDREGLQRPILLAHRGGVVFAHAVAKRWRDRIGGIVAVSPSGPLKTIRDFATLQGYHRAFAICSSLARPLLPVLMRSWSRSVRRKGVEVLLTRQSSSGRLDADLVANLNLAPLLRHSHDFAMRQGGAGFIADVDLIMRDWRPLVSGKAGAAPAVYLYGSEEPTSEGTRDISVTGQNSQYRVCEGADGTLLYTRPELILAALEDLANQQAHAEGQMAALS
jgi:pimeloyl-ACP methyl ester carboxylesterase